MMPESTPEADRAEVEMERTVKLKMTADKAFRNILTFIRLSMKVACSYQELLTSK